MGECSGWNDCEIRCQYSEEVPEWCGIGRYGKIGQLRFGYGRENGRQAYSDDYEDWAKRIDIILEAGGDAILNDAGKITAEFAKSFAESEFEKYRIIQDRLFKSDFDRLNDCDLLNTIE